MTWYAWVAWGVAIASSAYSAVRWWREDRRRAATETKWVIEHFQNDAFTLTSRLPYRAEHVTVGSDVKFAKAIKDATFEPGESETFMPSLTYGSGSGAKMTVTWRRPWKRKPDSQVLLLPPKPRR